MRKFYSVLCAAVVLVTAAVSCQPAAEPVKLDINQCNIASTAVFGEAVDFSIALPEGAEVSSVTAALIKGGKQIVEKTIRMDASSAHSSSVGGVLDIPYTKNIEDGEYDVMFVATGNNERAEKTVKINIAHPEFKSVTLMADSQKFGLAAAEGVWAYTGALPASLAGYFEAKTADGTVYTFGGNSVDNVAYGNTTAIELYNYSDAIPQGTISFDVVSFQVKYPLETKWVDVPETTDPAYPGTIDVDFKKGQLVAFTHSAGLWIDVDFFQDNGDGTYTFRAEGGKYRLTNQADWGSLRVERISSSTGDLGTFAWDDAGNITVNEAIWCLGNYNFGKPDKRSVRDGRVFSDWETYDAYCMAKIDDYKYQITLRVYNLATFKFFCTKLNWGDIYGTNYNLSRSELSGLINVYSSALIGNGNFQQGTGLTDPNAIMYPEEGKVMRFTFDVSNPLGIIITAEEAEM